MTEHIRVFVLTSELANSLQRRSIQGAKSSLATLNLSEEDLATVQCQGKIHIDFQGKMSSDPTGMQTVGNQLS